MRHEGRRILLHSAVDDTPASCSASESRYRPLEGGCTIAMLKRDPAKLKKVSVALPFGSARPNGRRSQRTAALVALRGAGDRIATQRST